MKKIFLLALLANTLFANAQQVQNPGFENWTTGSHVFPVDWGTFSEAFVNIGQQDPHLEVQTPIAHSGNYAILVQNEPLGLAGGSTILGSTCSCPITYSGGYPVYGFTPYTSIPTSYDFWYKFNALSGDNALTRLYITKWNTGTNKRDTLASAYTLITGPVSVYTHTTIPINWLITTETPDSIQLSFNSSLHTTNAPSGGQLYLDDINFNEPTGIKQLTASNEQLSIYPNPNNGSFVIEPSSATKQLMQVYDVTGKVVLSQPINGKTSVDATSLNEGVYNISLQSNEGVVNKRLVIVR